MLLISLSLHRHVEQASFPVCKMEQQFATACLKRHHEPVAMLSVTIGTAGRNAFFISMIVSPLQILSQAVENLPQCAMMRW